MAVMGTLKFLLVAVTFAGCAAADNGDDFSNNLLSDLGPLLALFGEQVTMQFMSQSMGWSDNVIMAMVPIGIITSIISAIRVGGPTWLKAIIGRARENFSAAEAELMSSTSNEVCELWNGNDIVRCMGTAPIAEFICLVPEDMESAGSDPKTSPKIMACDLDQALANGYLRDIDSNDQDTDPIQISSKYHTESKAEKGQASTESSQPEIIIVRNTTSHAPNISLNSHSQFGRTEVRIVAVIGTILQLGILILATFATYYPTKKFFKDGQRIAPYAFVCFVVGTILLVLGGLLCAHVVETSTDERVYRPGLGRKARIVWLQKTNAVSDQVFDSFALFPMDERTIITTSHRASKLIQGNSLALETVIGTMVSVCGFILQFIGFRGMSWIVTLTQLGAVLTMAGLRAWVRRGLAKPLRCKRLTPGLELEWFASTLRDIDRTGLDASQDTTTCSKDWRIMTGGSPAYERLHGDKEPMEEDSKAHSVMMTRRDLGQLADWRGPASAEAVALARALEVTMDALFFDSPARKFTWSLKAFCGDIHFRLERQQTGSWKAYSDEIEAALSLWLYSVNEQEHRHNKQQLEREEILKRARKDDAWLRAKGSPAKPSLRLLGPCVPGLHRDLHWWMPRDTSSRIVEVEEAEEGPLEVENHRIVGYGMDPSEDEDDSATLKEHKTDDGGSDPGLAYQQLNNQTRQYNRRELAKLSFDETDLSKGRTGHTHLAIESYSPLELLYAQDMFSAFIWAAAKTLSDPIGGDADLRPDETSDGPGSPKHWNWKSRRNLPEHHPTTQYGAQASAS
ncbi:hypothetical protein EDB80DRAFT_364139 [Ilyonectria destructans]|nr:hypothetical protein EDB80DRAFT_364139 [Ilyonectria destructans]